MSLVKINNCFIIALLLIGEYCSAESIPFDSKRWEIKAQESKIETYLGQPSLLLKSGLAVVKDSEFAEGIIEYDVAFGPERNFIGAVWHLQDLKNYEEFYMRPHQSGNPDATQYTPVFNGSDGWQLYSGEGYNARVKYSFNEWIHVRIVISGNRAEVYIHEMDNPKLFISDLKHHTHSGKVGVRSGDGAEAPVHFANFSFTKTDAPPLKGTTKPPVATPPGIITSWEVSNSFDEKLLLDKLNLTAADKQTLTWQPLTGEDSGLTNLAKIQGPEKGKNTVFARVTISSETDQVKLLPFGFSDRVKVYFNDQLLYSGNDTYGTRDYRFLGTMGYFDELSLPLRKGENQLWLAVSETFGGWGIQAKFTDLTGISIK